MTKVAAQFARRLALIAFATATLRGLICEADFFGTIQTALIALGALYLLGLIVGEVARRVVEETVRADLARQAGAASAANATAQSK
jgi:hypothetical protein